MVSQNQIKKKKLPIQPSMELRKKLRYGVLKKMAKAFGQSYGSISLIVSGQRNGKNPDILKATAEIIEMGLEFDKKIDEILNKYKD